jgi:prolyl oligopeptidase
MRRSRWRRTLASPVILPLVLACATTPPAPEPTSSAPQPTPVVDSPEPTSSLRYPETRREDIVDEKGGKRVADPYRWLEDAKVPEVAAWMRAQDALSRAFLSELPGRDALAERIAELTYIDAVSPPYRRGDRFFYSRSHADKEKAVHYVKRGANGKEEVLIDPNLLSDDGSISVSGLTPSHSGRFVAYKLSKNNADAATMYVRDLKTGSDSEIDVIEGARYASAAWTPDDKGFYYVALPVGEEVPVAEMPGRAHIRYHVLGTDPASDEIVVPATGDPRMFLGVGVSEDGHWLLQYKVRGKTTEIYFRDRRGRSAEFVPLATGFDARYSADIYRDKFYVTTNAGAPNNRVYMVDPKKPAREAWKEIVPERDHLLQGAYVVGKHLVLSYLHNAHDRLEVHDLSGKLVREVTLPGLGSASGFIGREDDDEAYYSFSSLTSPPQIYQTSVSTGETKLWATIDYPVDTTKLEARQVWFPSKDGTKVSMFVLHQKGIDLDGSHPTLLSGYGGFNVSLGAEFSAYAVAWVEQGGVFAKANLRGGGEYGEAWHEAGMLGKKQNVFDDFIAASEFLVKEGYTRPDKLAISGGSNGGLLVGAAMVQRPDLYGAVICSVPLLDMVRYHLFGSGKTWIPEYGDPDDPQHFQWLVSYSPYHQVKDGTRYPALLMESADSDDRVDPMHARKFVAAIQAANASDRPAILRIERNAGHGGAGLRKKYVEETVDEFTFLWKALEVTPKRAG